MEVGGIHRRSWVTILERVNRSDQSFYWTHWLKNPRPPPPPHTHTYTSFSTTPDMTCAHKKILPVYNGSVSVACCEYNSRTWHCSHQEESSEEIHVVVIHHASYATYNDAPSLPSWWRPVNHVLVTQIHDCQNCGKCLSSLFSHFPTIPCWDFGSLHLGKATATTRAALPSSTSVWDVSVFTWVSL